MPYPKLPAPAPGEALLTCACYEQDTPLWNGVLRALGGRRDGDVLALADGSVRLRLARHPGWGSLHGGNVPALLPESCEAPPVAVLADTAAVYGGHLLLLVDLRDVPGRGVRIPADRLASVLRSVLDGSLRFDRLVRDMDRMGIHGGDGGAPATPTPTAVVRRTYPQLPAGDGTLLVRTDFADGAGWQSLLDALGERDEDGLFTGEGLTEGPELFADLVEGPEFAHLQPGQVPALVPPATHPVMVVLADAEALADPAHPLLAVDLYDTPGQAARVPLAEIGSMAVNLEIANMDFGDFV